MGKSYSKNIFSIFKNRQRGINNLSEIIEGVQYIADDSAWDSQKFNGRRGFFSIYTITEKARFFYVALAIKVWAKKKAEIELLVIHRITIFE